MNGKLTILTDLNAVNSLPPFVNVIYMGDTSNIQISPNGVLGRCMLPSYEASLAYFDARNVQMFERMYTMQLNNDHTIREFIATLLKALQLGKQMVIYLTPDEYNMYYTLIHNVFVTNYGIYIENPMVNIPYLVDGAKHNNGLSLMLENDIITLDEFMRMLDTTNPSLSEGMIIMVAKLMNIPIYNEFDMKNTTEFVYNTARISQNLLEVTDCFVGK